MSTAHRLKIVAASLLLLGAPGCSNRDPGAGSIPAPIVTPDAPQTSEEAAAQEQAELEAQMRP